VVPGGDGSRGADAEAPSFGDDGEPVLPAEVSEPFTGIARAALKKDPTQRISVTGIRTKLNPASAPAAIEAPKVPPRIGPVACAGFEGFAASGCRARAPVPAATRPIPSPSAGQKRSYVLPVTVAAVVLCFVAGLAEAVSPEVRRGAAGGHEQFEHSGKFVSGEPLSSSKTSYLDAKKEFLAAPELTETSQPALRPSLLRRR